MKLSRHTAVFLILFAFCFSSCGFAETATPSSKSSAWSTKNPSVELTVYNGDFALVKETRLLNLSTGTHVLPWENVAASLEPESVMVEALGQPARWQVLEKNFEYDLINQGTLLEKYLGEQIKLVVWNEYQDRKETVSARLLSNDGPIYEVGNEIFIGHPGVTVLPRLPEGLTVEPTLLLKYDSKISGSESARLTYLANHVGWTANYILLLDASATRADLSAWVTLHNRSGTTFTDAKLTCIAGSVNRLNRGGVYQKPQLQLRNAAVMMDAGEAFSGMQQAAFADYHRYDLGRRVTVKNNENKQVRFYEGRGIAVSREYQVRANQSYVYFQNTGSTQNKLPVQIFLKWKNSAKNQSGIPLPAGTLKVYREDADGARQFVGEAALGHTPKDEEIEVSIGEAFDLVVEKKQTDYRKITNQLHESEWEVTLKNRKEEGVTIDYRESFSNNWQVLQSSHPHEKEDAFTLKYSVMVPANSEIKLRYRVQVGL